MNKLIHVGAFGRILATEGTALSRRSVWHGDCHCPLFAAPGRRRLSKMKTEGLSSGSHMRIAEFTLDRPRDVAWSADRARLLGSLAGLSPKRRTSFGKAVQVILLLKQMTFFLEDSPILVRDIEDALDRHDGKQLQMSAHRLRGLAAGFDNRTLVEATAQLEEIGGDGNFQRVSDDQMRRLRQAWECLSAALQTYVSGAGKNVRKPQ